MTTNTEIMTRPAAHTWWWYGLLLLATIGILTIYQDVLDVYEVSILIFTAISMGLVGNHWPGFRAHAVAVAILSLIALQLYGTDLGAAETNGLLKYMLASQSAIMWMSVFFIAATFTYFGGLIFRSDYTEKVGSAFTWIATTFGMTGLMVRWRETHMMGADIGYIPVSNLYEVFILFAVVTALIYLFYERRYQVRSLGGFVLLVISAAVIFQLWYAFERNAHEIQPLVPALQSYWMKIHVPANFIGYGAFAMAAMIGIAYLLVNWRMEKSPNSGMVKAMPPLTMMDDLMYKSIALGFAFFTVATILGALWAAEAWGGYWSWDPKETWALIVWLNYAAWLHMRMTKGWSGAPMAWWAIVGLFVTLFAFLGVNMFLSGLHSYGTL
ncbi:c-type cytochrome biogenesis protein CcsB [Methylophaga pinxianii]|uniref:c-type cytochrome biogenesis protein CcsB n=1 Tax=Methylophaga pinxianii TaxID=2881052 RepID=UPI001CF19D2D|nr:c-type cytochrome biogenesis protein CcsB [Methylophaga pinxianii]MCB2425938.1 c-type cytochrome biogenesis protein CcsB [Methylophaga pinxianii]UPH46419.1 c-type cytochrome biogenesis protein CcsB [Methylophaga pinxianii]